VAEGADESRTMLASLLAKRSLETAIGQYALNGSNLCKSYNGDLWRSPWLASTTLPNIGKRHTFTSIWLRQKEIKIAFGSPFAFPTKPSHLTRLQDAVACETTIRKWSEPGAWKLASCPPQ